jgi:hypothetical protein
VWKRESCRQYQRKTGVNPVRRKRKGSSAMIIS